MKEFEPLPRLLSTQEDTTLQSQTRPLPDLDRLMATYGDALLRLCFMYLKDVHLAQDAVQETFLKAYKNYGYFEEGRGEKTWINRVAINVCKDMLRSAWNRRVNVVEQLNEIEDEHSILEDPDNTLLTAVMDLKPHYKDVILLFYYQDMKIVDIAKTLDVPDSTVSVRLKRAREILKKHLGGWYYDEQP